MFRMIVYPCCLKDSARIGPELEKIALSGKVPDSTGQYRTMIDVFALNDTIDSISTHRDGNSECLTVRLRKFR